MLKTVNPFLLITISIFLLLFAPMAIQDGMFMDGTLYANVAKNLAHGKGTFWYQTFSETIHPQFHEQLPLFAFLESLFFRLLGDSIYVEFIFQLILAIITIYFFIKIWKVVFGSQNYPYSWLPIFLWTIIPVVFWSYINNVQETLMVVFTMSSVCYMLLAVKEKRKVFINLTLSAILIFLASFCKGVQGVFPIVGVMFFWFSYRTISFKTSLLYTGYLFLIIGVIVAFMLVNETSYGSLKAYYDSRIVATFTNDYSKVTPNRLHLLWILIQQLIPVFIFLGIIFLVSKLKKQKMTEYYRKPFVFFLLIAISGSLPLMVTLEQRNFYLCTSLPFYALSFSALILPYVKGVLKVEYHQKLRKISVIVFAVSLITPLFFIGKTYRDKDLLSDIHEIGSFVGHNETIGVHQSLYLDHFTIMYFYRFYEISIDKHNDSRDYFISYKEDIDFPRGYTEIENKELKKFKLYKK